jgi:hypothetical protein
MLTQNNQRERNNERERRAAPAALSSRRLACVGCKTQ